MSLDKVFTRLFSCESYDNAEFTLGGAVTNYDVKTNQVTLFVNAVKARTVEIITDATITVKFNANTNAAITVTSTEGKYTISPLVERLIVSNIYITTTGAANIKIRLFP